MKNYILILLSVIGVTLLLNSAPKNHPDILSDIDTTASKSLVVPVTETHLEPITEDVSSIQIDSTFNSTQPETPIKSSRTPNYSISKVSANIAKNPGNDIIKVGKLIYGHNSTKLLGSALKLGTGSIFTVSENGTTTTYQVASTALFKKLDNYTLNLCNANNYTDCNHGTYYMESFKNAYFKGKNYSIALFTCDGDSLGGGDATHRKVVFANQI